MLIQIKEKNATDNFKKGFFKWMINSASDENSRKFKKKNKSINNAKNYKKICEQTVFFSRKVFSVSFCCYS